MDFLPMFQQQQQQSTFFNSLSSYSDDDFFHHETEEFIMPLHQHQQHQQQPASFFFAQPPSKYNNNHFNSYLDLSNKRNFHHHHHQKHHRYHNLMNNKNYKIVEEEYINMTSQQQQQPPQRGGGMNMKQNGAGHMENLINGFKNMTREYTEEHIDLTGGSNGDVHIGDYNAQRRPSFKRQVVQAVPYNLAQPDGQVQGLQRTPSAQNIHVDQRLADSERNINYCIRFAVNGLSKSHMGSTPAINKNIQAGDFGDDSGMIAENSKSIVIGLADGAGGNREIGIDPKKFSRALLGFCVEIIKNEEVLPHQVSKLASRAVQHLERRNIVGSGTLCLLSLNKETNIMSAMNLGDSGFRLIRNGKIRHKSNATMAGSSPRQVFVTESSFSGISFVDENDLGRDADMREFRVKKGDVIVMSSDGLFDVLKDSEVERVVNSHHPNDLQGIADELLQLSMRSYLHTHRDDILVMVSRVELKKNY